MIQLPLSNKQAWLIAVLGQLFGFGARMAHGGLVRFLVLRSCQLLISCLHDLVLQSSFSEEKTPVCEFSPISEPPYFRLLYLSFCLVHDTCILKIWILRLHFFSPVNLLQFDCLRDIFSVLVLVFHYKLLCFIFWFCWWVA